ncbi:hypothetical protein [Amycolatopsis cihanbeyliensis]|uniref:hypothetical protein n=1 Tax=Amycolatopsis cihanbeyliensis TaxID=1128664 RepID=UPI0011540630|nr:hypothetical protein [Amycolatopsis cihanbeyliensis]
MPSVVVGRLTELDARPGHRVFEVGTGTGWSAALLAHIIGVQGQVTIDRQSVTLPPDGNLPAHAHG